MSDYFRVVIEDSRSLREICGINDNHVKTLEDIFGIKIYNQGNELILDSEDTEVQNFFSQVINCIQIQISKGQKVSRDMIVTIVDALRADDLQGLDDLFNSNIIIPHGFYKVFPRSFHQTMYIKGIQTHDLSFGIGPAGTGKTFLAIAQALSEVLGKKQRKLVLTRPVVEAGESLGFLPGDLSQKLNPYLKPLYDAMEALVPAEILNRMEENRLIEIAPLAYMRGRSLQNCFIVLDEAQNTTREQMKMFLTRLGEGSKTIITGDVTQIDLPNSKNSGLIHAMKVIKGIEDIHFSHFTHSDVVRSSLVKKIIRAYETEKKTS
ncbi:PhoH family protein [Spirochaeta cellobiosiphila]|uniref:PhoH family protein n=1 Tax=Spirochaeta cellobiosiphila TaxID=504483 RepID=UPI000424426B|nr:PhoH family protein [Spirochaeta cellobiosiphila]